MRPQPLIAVHDVEASSQWYQRLLGCTSAHGGKEYERLEANGVLVMQLHHFEVDHHHGKIGDPANKPYGNGVLLWFELDDFDAAAIRANELNAEIVMPKHRNPPEGDGGPNHWEIWLRDPDRYTVVLASPDGSAVRRLKGWWAPCPCEAEAHRLRSPLGGKRSADLGPAGACPVRQLSGEVAC